MFPIVTHRVHLRTHFLAKMIPFPICQFYPFFGYRCQLIQIAHCPNYRVYYYLGTYLPTYLLMYIYLPTYIICLPALFGSINLEVIIPSCTKSSYPDLESKNTYSWPCSLWTLFPYTMRLTDAKLVCDLGFAVFFVCTA